MAGGHASTSDPCSWCLGRKVGPWEEEEPGVNISWHLKPLISLKQAKSARHLLLSQAGLKRSAARLPPREAPGGMFHLVWLLEAPESPSSRSQILL